MTFHIFFDRIYFFILAACIISGLFAWRKSRNSFRLLGIFMLITMFVEVIARWMLKAYNHNDEIYIIYDILNFIISSLIINLFVIARKNKMIIIYSASTALLLYISDVCLLKRYIVDYSLINCFISIYFCFVSCMYLLDLMENPKEKRLPQQPEFLYAMISLFYYSVSLLFWIVFFRFRDPEAQNVVNLTNKIFLISNLIFYMGILFVIILEVKTNSGKNESRYA